jgi:hypothetical protein
VTAAELKKALQQEGLQVYRSSESEVRLAERIRENLILDSGIAVTTSLPTMVRVVFRAEKHLFAGESDAALYARARALAENMKRDGFSETGERTASVADPAENSRVIDTIFEVSFEKPVADVKEAAEVCKALLRAPRTAHL